MLEPQFFISPEPVPQGIEFKVLGYARVGRYTLVRWRWGLATLEGVDLDDLSEGPYSEGESLWAGDRLLGHYWDGADLYGAAALTQTQTPRTPASVWDEIDPRVGRDGISPDVAIALRKPQNYVCFRGDRAPLFLR
jgi:hypothetical protein